MRPRPVWTSSATSSAPWRCGQLAQRRRRTRPAAGARRLRAGSARRPPHATSLARRAPAPARRCRRTAASRRPAGAARTDRGTGRASSARRCPRAAVVGALEREDARPARRGGARQLERRLDGVAARAARRRRSSSPVRSQSRRASRPANGLTRDGNQLGASRLEEVAHAPRATAGLRWPKRLRAVEVLDRVPVARRPARPPVGADDAQSARPRARARCAISGLTNSRNSSNPLRRMSSKSRRRASASLEPSVGDDLGARHERVLVRDQEHRERGDLLGGAEPPERALAEVLGDAVLRQQLRQARRRAGRARAGSPVMS